MEKLPILEAYYSRLIALERRAPLTAQTYRFEIRRFLEWLGEEKLSLPKAELSDVIRYLAHRRYVDGIDSRSVAKAISALRSFSRFLEDDGINATGFVTLLQTPRRQDRLPEVHRKEDVDHLLSLIDTVSPLGIRNRALYEFIYSAGLRISEAVSANVSDLFLSKSLARVTGKGRKERLVIFGPEAAFWLKRYMGEVRQKLLGKINSRALFINRNGKRLSRKGIWKNYRNLAIQAGLSTKLHTLRHTFATEMLAGGADLRSVQELLGHSEITTTQIYTHIDSARLRDSHRKYLPTLKTYRS
ncbi:MAG: tyrosine-type recombinase/integrase [Treponema sp.]|nr:tyrosine-type recombinase/integrase [Treponema sp.]